MYSYKTDNSLESETIHLPLNMKGFSYFGTTFTKISITMYGVCRLFSDEKKKVFRNRLGNFDQKSKTEALIAPFWSSLVDTSRVYYERVVQDQATLGLSGCDILSAHPDLEPFEPKAALLVTWLDVKKVRQTHSTTHTF